MELLDVGQVVVTVDVAVHLDQDDLSSAILRHQSGDWGNINGDQRGRNLRALDCVGKDRITSRYRARSGKDFLVMTEGDRAYTLVKMVDDAVRVAA